MIEYSLPSRRQPPVKTGFVPAPALVSPTAQTIIGEAKRRDDIIKQMFKNCPYKEGDIVKPYSAAGIKQYGDDVIVEKICDTYAKMGKSEEWPKDDCPMIVTAWSNKTSSRFFCTVGYLEKK